MSYKKDTRKIIDALERYYSDDSGRVKHAKTVLKYAKMINEKERGDSSVVIPSAILHDVGIKAAEKIYGSSDGHLQEKEGPDVARLILRKLSVPEPEITEICDIIAHHHTPRAMDSLNFRILLDADMITNLLDDENDIRITKESVEKTFHTETGRNIAIKELFK